MNVRLLPVGRFERAPSIAFGRVRCSGCLPVKLETLFNTTGAIMIRSMTTFARKDTRGDWRTLTCEIRTVNHRYLERSEEHTSELQSRPQLVCRLLRENTNVAIM